MTGNAHCHAEMLQAALQYSQSGWHVVPLHTPVERGECSCGRPGCGQAGKHPRTEHGVRDAATNELTIRQWWSRWPNANIGIACGPSGLVVLDVDPRSGGEVSLRELIPRVMQETITALTGGGGQHLIYAAPKSQVVGNSTGKLGPGLDIKAAGGYIVAPPSLHASGRRYEWEVGYGPFDRLPSPLPEALKRLSAHEPDGKRPGHASAHWRSVAAHGAPQGERNCTVAGLTGHLLRRGVDPVVTLELLLAWNVARNTPPLPDEEVSRTVDSVARAELQRREGRADR